MSERSTSRERRAVTAAIKAARDAGETGAVSVETEVAGRKIVVVAYPPGEEPKGGTPLDEWLKTHAGSNEGD